MTEETNATSYTDIMKAAKENYQNSLTRLETARMPLAVMGYADATSCLHSATEAFFGASLNLNRLDLEYKRLAIIIPKVAKVACALDDIALARFTAETARFRNRPANSDFDIAREATQALSIAQAVLEKFPARKELITEIHQACVNLNSRLAQQ